LPTIAATVARHGTPCELVLGSAVKKYIDPFASAPEA
jgi:hypothetical protein